MSDQPTWVNNPDDPREKMRLALAEEFMVKHGTTILYDLGATVVGWMCTQPELVAGQPELVRGVRHWDRRDRLRHSSAAHASGRAAAGAGLGMY